MTYISTREAITAMGGIPDGEARFETFEIVVEVLKYEPVKTREGVVIYVTSTIGRNDAGHFKEFLVGLDGPHDDVADPLARLSAFARASPIHDGDTVPMDEPLWPGTDMRRWMATTQREAGIGPSTIDGRHVEFMNGIPISESELEAKQRLGVDGFLAELRDNGLGLWVAGRPSLASDIRRR